MVCNLFCSVFTSFFFYGTKVDSATGKSSPIVTTKGLQHLKKGLDLAWGVRLTYKVDFSKYEETYKNDLTQLTDVKKTALEIILKNVDKRISTLGVSDYNAYVQRLTDGEYIVVEIGWVQDIEAAKNLIGKTVELEFKLQNNESAVSASGIQARQNLANTLLESAKQTPDSMEDLGTTKGSEDVAYNDFVDVTVDQHPLIYKDNLDALTSVASGSVYPTLLTGVYHVFPMQNESWELLEQPVNGYLVTRYNGKREVDVTDITAGDIYAFAASRDIKPVESVVSQKPEQGAVYNDNEKAVLFGGEEILPNTAGYDVAIYQNPHGYLIFPRHPSNTLSLHILFWPIHLWFDQWILILSRSISHFIIFLGKINI